MCSMPLSIILHNQKVSEITESHQCKNSVMYRKILMLLYFIIWKMRKEVLWKFFASGSREDTSSFTPILLFLKNFFITSYESDVVIPYVTTGRNPFVPIYYRQHSSTIEKFGKLIFASVKSVESPGRDESCVLLDPDDESLQVAEKNYSLH